MINFVLKSRLSQIAKLKLNSSYESVAALIIDLRKELLAKKSPTAILSKLQNVKQNESSVSDFGKEITDLFINLTISQADGNSDYYKVLKPINEKFAIKQFADGLRNRRLSTIICARNYSTLKDAVQAAQDEDVTRSSATNEVLGMYKTQLFHNRGRFNNYRGVHRGYDNNRSVSNRGQGQNSYGNRQRGWHQPTTPVTAHQPRGRRPTRGNFYYRNSNNRFQGVRRQHNINTMREMEETRNDQPNTSQPEVSPNMFFRD